MNGYLNYKLVVLLLKNNQVLIKNKPNLNRF